MTLDKLCNVLKTSTNKNMWHVYDTCTEIHTQIWASYLKSAVRQIQDTIVIDKSTVVLDYQGNTVANGADLNSILYKN